ncbi:hypothetical protein LR48_Vigan02g115600 [Vigna angularis]|uniref:Uncharacterized protein n=1 Tax=Phaseolus angularis TaxID=3914 RepID=A0A0L9TWY9_PHAAN|nr:hypothetical protein LR48_Vigan02g115600 [Vigna angularis]
MAKKPVKYFVVDAFTDVPFKGNPAAVCFLEEEEERSDHWLQAVAAEFNISQTCFLTRIVDSPNGTSNPRFRLRWFTPITEVKLCGHATLAAAHTLFSSEVKPQLDAIVKCSGRGIIVSGIAPPGSGFDFYSRFFCPKFGINEDPACGTAHCSLACYWSKKLGKYDLNAYQASPRGAIFNISLDEQNQRVLLRGKAVTVMEGCVLA